MHAPPPARPPDVARAPHCHVLVVEDDQTIALNLVEYLEAQGFEVDIAYDGDAALRQLARQTFDVLLLDLGLPRRDGQQVLQALRHELALDLPVLVLTARDALASKLACFEAGADDYLLKPFALAEVAWRVRALHRRHRGERAAPALVAGPIQLDRRTREVRVAGELVHLTPRGQQLLACLMLDPGRVVTRVELERDLWPDGSPDSDALRSQIHLLRRALGPQAAEQIETVHGVGWRLMVPPPEAPEPR